MLNDAFIIFFKKKIKYLISFIKNGNISLVKTLKHRGSKLEKIGKDRRTPML